MLREMQDDTPGTMSYIRALNFFKDETIPAILDGCQNLFLKYMEILREGRGNEVVIDNTFMTIDTMAACLSFDQAMVERLNSKNIYKYIKTAHDRVDIFDGSLSWTSTHIITALNDLYNTFKSQQ